MLAITRSLVFATVIGSAGWAVAPRPLAAEEAAKPATDPSGIEFFERKIRPIFAKRCYECHSTTAGKSQGGLQIDARTALLAGGDSGPAIVPGKPEESLLIEAIGPDGSVEMPPDGRLPPEEVALLREWVGHGAPMPDDRSAAAVKKKIDFEAGRNFWSFLPVHAVAPPAVVAADWVRRPIDAFILAALEQRSLGPSPPADKRTLLRRASFDPVGLPPTPDEVQAFEQDDSPDAYPRLVERLLASPHYGERWGRYWLDLARYSDNAAAHEPTKARGWVYRDWIVRALNEDMPYDEFVRRQLAADMMAGTAAADRAALGFLGISPVFWKEPALDKEVIKAIVADEWEERIDVVGRTFLGLTLACARCHDHKYDPISAEDYYAVAGVLANTRLVDSPIIPDPEGTVAFKAVLRVATLEEDLKKLQETKPPPADLDQKIAAIKGEIGELKKTPHFSSPLAFAVDDAALDVLADGDARTKLVYRPGETDDVALQIRGSPSNLGPVVPRRFLTVLSPAAPEPFRKGSGRLELAESIVTTAAPLAARVIVNRVWKQHFGRGLVETPSDFGTQGAAPTHPELLTDLTHRFIENGWSIKWLHREIMLSAAYRQSSGSNATHLASDPENRWYWRMSRQRLDVEAWRDAMLSVCGTLDLRVGGAPKSLADAGNNRRTLYGLIDRQEPDDMLRLYDFPDAFIHSPHREPTTTALQQLFVLNSPFLQRQAAALAARITAPAGAGEPTPTVPDQIRRAYQLLFGRDPTDNEMRIGGTFLTEGQTDRPPGADAWAHYAQALLGSNEFLFID